MLLFKGSVRGAFCALSRHGFRGFDWEFCLTLALLLNANSMKFSADSTTFSFLPFSSYLHVCIRSILFSVLFFLVGLYHIVIVSRVVITDCSSSVNFLLVCVITPCYVIIFIKLCHILYCKFI